MSRRYVTPKDTILSAENNLIHMHCADGSIYENLEPRRLFPINRPSEYITLLDAEGKEMAVIRSMEELGEECRRVIQASLDDYYLVPEIICIVNTVEKYGRLHWIVDTDRGRKEFDIRNRNSDIRISPDGHVRVRDSDDNRYTIKNWKSLDKHSRSMLIADL